LEPTPVPHGSMNPIELLEMESSVTSWPPPLAVKVLPLNEPHSIDNSTPAFAFQRAGQKRKRWNRVRGPAWAPQPVGNSPPGGLESCWPEMVTVGDGFVVVR